MGLSVEGANFTLLGQAVELSAFGQGLVAEIFDKGAHMTILIKGVLGAK